jgi:hypothetical protein
MQYVQFAQKKQGVDLLLVLALWHELVAEWHGEQVNPLEGALLQGGSRGSLASYLSGNAQRACRFDVVLRLSSGYLDTMHATPAFFQGPENKLWFIALPGKRVDGGDPKLPASMVALTPKAIAFWNADPAASAAAIAQARALLESDIESGGTIVALLPAQPEAVRARFAAVREEPRAGLDRTGHVHALVRSLQTSPLQPMYWKKPLGAPVTGWDARLLAYFWPKPEAGYRATADGMQAIEASANVLAEALDAAGSWNPAQQEQAVALAEAIFLWGDVPQDPATVTAGHVERVFRAALGNDAAAKAPMNSGWTKVAAFASACRETRSGGKPQVIWDSRVAASITSRLDAQLPVDVAPESLFPGVGTVPGRGGSRPRSLSRRWPSAYRTWTGQVSGSAIVREMRDHLNDPAQGYPRMPLPDGGTGAWTTRGVEMVLFMDGY